MEQADSLAAGGLFLPQLYILSSKLLLRSGRGRTPGCESFSALPPFGKTIFHNHRLDWCASGWWLFKSWYCSVVENDVKESVGNSLIIADSMAKPWQHQFHSLAADSGKLSYTLLQLFTQLLWQKCSIRTQIGTVCGINFRHIESSPNSTCPRRYPIKALNSLKRKSILKSENILWALVTETPIPLHQFSLLAQRNTEWHSKYEGNSW